MKKTITIILIILCILSISSIAFATEDTEIMKNTEEAEEKVLVKKNSTEAEQKIEETKNEYKKEMEKKKEKYTERYGSEEYWFAGFIIEDIVQPYSIPLCFLGIAVGLLFQFAMGTRRLDYKHRGFTMVIVFVSVLAVCQILPFIYALVVTGWRG